MQTFSVTEVHRQFREVFWDEESIIIINGFSIIYWYVICMWTERFREKKRKVKRKKDYDLLVWEDDKKGVGLEPAVKSFEEKYKVKK